MASFLISSRYPPKGKPVTTKLRAKNSPIHEQLKERARQAGLAYVYSDMIPYSRFALEAAEGARGRDVIDDFHATIFRKYFKEGQDIGDWAVLREAAEDVGIDPYELQHEVESGKYRGVLDRQVQRACALGVKSISTYVLNDKYVIVGAQPLQVFQRLIAKLNLRDIAH